MRWGGRDGAVAHVDFGIMLNVRYAKDLVELKIKLSSEFVQVRHPQPSAGHGRPTNAYALKSPSLLCVSAVGACVCVSCARAHMPVPTDDAPRVSECCAFVTPTSGWGARDWERAVGGVGAAGDWEWGVGR
eukprot:3014948-Rhodomonas_salina.1